MPINPDSKKDLEAIPFSRAGTFLCFSIINQEKAHRKEIPQGLWFRSVHGAGSQEIAHIELAEGGQSCPYNIESTPSKLTLRTQKGKVELCISSSSTVRLRLTRTSLQFNFPVFRNHGVIQESPSSWMINLAGTFHSYRLIALSGDIEMDAPWETKRCQHIKVNFSSKNQDPAEFAIEQLTWTAPPLKHDTPFEKICLDTQEEFVSFAKPYLNGPDHLFEASHRAAYLNWSCLVPPSGNITRPAMFMSNNGMTNIWAWDHAFNALATQLTSPDLAWDQLMVIFDHQNEEGQIPDYFNDVNLLTTFVKPPIHGWILSLIIEFGGPLTQSRAEEAYHKLSKWTLWWLKHRNPDGDDLPVYWHGNDSGWDNATSFDLPFPIKSPELASFLILQMECLAQLAQSLGLSREAQAWKKNSEEVLSKLLEKLWNGNTFKALSTATGQSAPNSDSIFNCLPIVLGERLPLAIRDALAIEIKRHLTEWGPATEHPNSPSYEANGYWRGPIWAPPVMILVDGCMKAGQNDLALDIASRFCKLCQKSGFAENFDAISGRPLCDPGYTWTSSIFLILSQRYLSL